MMILLVEDDAVTRRLLHAILTAQGHEVTEAENGREAWGAWQLSAPRVVVADWVMPEVDGLELCRKIRAVVGRPYTYFILQTSRSGPARIPTSLTDSPSKYCPTGPKATIARDG